MQEGASFSNAGAAHSYLNNTIFKLNNHYNGSWPWRKERANYKNSIPRLNVKDYFKGQGQENWVYALYNYFTVNKEGLKSVCRWLGFFVFCFKMTLSSPLPQHLC